MKNIALVSLIVFLGSCHPAYFRPVKSTLPKGESSSKECKGLEEFIENNFFYSKKCNCFILSKESLNLIYREYGLCFRKMNLEEAKKIFGKPSFEGEDYACYEFYLFLPDEKLVKTFKLWEGKSGLRIINKEDGKMKFDNYDKCPCNLDKN